MYATAKMIYPQKHIAEAILGKMRDANAGAKFELFELPIGFTKLPDFMPLPIPMPVAKKAAVTFAPNPDVTEFAVYVKSETDKWLTLTNPVGPKNVRYVYKAHMLSIEKQGDMTLLRMPTKVAIAKGIVEGGK
jgi:hypothetical protein